MLKLKFKSNQSIITKTLKRVVKKTFYQITKNENSLSNIKPIKIGKQPGATYNFGCKD